MTVTVKEGIMDVPVEFGLDATRLNGEDKSTDGTEDRDGGAGDAGGVCFELNDESETASTSIWSLGRRIFWTCRS